MNKEGKNVYFTFLIDLIIFVLFCSSCAPNPKLVPTLAVSTISLTAIPSPTITPTSPPTPTKTTTPIPFPRLNLQPGDFFFSRDLQPSFIFSRNITGYKMGHYITFLDWTKTGGSSIVRFQLDSLGLGYNSDGSVDQDWAAQWDLIFDKALADGLYILPVFSGWFDWNSGKGYSNWSTNSLNTTNGGPATSPGELLIKDSATQLLWLQWMQSLINRWKDRENIVGWEIFSEVNLVSGSTESSGIEFVNTAAALIRASDPKRPVTASLADDGRWPNFYRDTNIDFINIHPYPTSAQLDRTIISEVHKKIQLYKRPVFIGESGLSAAENYPPKGVIGIRHAIWAAIVSGAMNGRSLYWEDSFGIYFPNLGQSWMEQFKLEEFAAANFVKGVDFSGFQPLTVNFSPGLWGAAVGNEKIVLGWFRDANCEPPDWDVLPVLSGQSVNVTIPGTTANWVVEFYDTRTGTDIVSTSRVTRTDEIITIKFPDFADDIAFKLFTQE